MGRVSRLPSLSRASWGSSQSGHRTMSLWRNEVLVKEKLICEQLGLQNIVLNKWCGPAPVSDGAKSSPVIIFFFSPSACALLGTAEQLIKFVKQGCCVSKGCTRDAGLGEPPLTEYKSELCAQRFFPSALRHGELREEESINQSPLHLEFPYITKDENQCVGSGPIHTVAIVGHLSVLIKSPSNILRRKKMTLTLFLL